MPRDPELTLSIDAVPLARPAKAAEQPRADAPAAAARPSDRPWTARSIEDIAAEAAQVADDRRYDESRLAALDEIVSAIRAAGVFEARIRARLEGLADDSRRDEQRRKLAGEPR